jgi:hypothetical protein
LAFTVTARHSGNSGATGVQTQATNSVTPTADSLLLTAAAAENDGHLTAKTWSMSGGSLTYTQIAASADAQWASSPTFEIAAIMYRAPIGGSPSAFAITVDAFSTTNTATYDVRSCDITGHNASTPVVQSKAASGQKAGSGANSEQGTVIFDTVPTAGNLIVVYFSAGADVASAPASPTAGVGKTFTAISTVSARDTNGGLWYRIADGTESATITCADLGDSVGNYGAVAVEIALAGGTEHTVTQTDSVGLTDVRLLAQSLVATDSAGLTDTRAFARSLVYSDSVGLADTATTQSGIPGYAVGYTSGYGELASSSDWIYGYLVQVG